MEASYTKIDPNNRDSVLWLQLALQRLYPGPGSFFHIGEMSPFTEKALRHYQLSRKLPLTGQPDEATMQKIHAELKERNLTP